MAIDLSRLKSQLLTSGLSQKDNPLFQIINQLIQQLQETATQVEAVIPSGGGSGLGTQSFITRGRELATLPNSRQLVAGPGITLQVTDSRLIISANFPLEKNEQIDDNSESLIGQQGPRGLKGKDGFNGLLNTDEQFEQEYVPVPLPTFFGQITFFSGPYTVATLPVGPRKGSVAYVTDALLPAFLAVAVGGGAVISPVFFDGTNWVSF